MTALAKVDLTSLTNPNFSSLAVVLTISLCLYQNRRWSSAQAREFLHLHSTLALITLHADLTPQRTHGETQSLVLFVLRSGFHYFSHFPCSTGGIQTPNERRPILGAAPPPPRHPGLPLHARRTALPPRGDGLYRLYCRISFWG